MEYNFGHESHPEELAAGDPYCLITMRGLTIAQHDSSTTIY